MNIAAAILYLFPDAVSNTDFQVRDDSDGNGPYIFSWTLKDEEGAAVSQPTAQEISDAWDAIKDIPVTPPKTEEQQQIEQLQADVAAANDATLTAYDALADVFEMVLALQDQIAGGGAE